MIGTATSDWPSLRSRHANFASLGIEVAIASAAFRISAFHLLSPLGAQACSHGCNPWTQPRQCTLRLIRAPLFPSTAVLWHLALGNWNFPQQYAYIRPPPNPRRQPPHTTRYMPPWPKISLKISTLPASFPRDPLARYGSPGH